MLNPMSTHARHPTADGGAPEPGTSALAPTVPHRKTAPSDGSMLGGARRIPHGLLSVVVGLGLWEAYVRLFHPSALVIVAPSIVCRKLYDMFASGSIDADLSISMKAFVIGYAISAAVAVPLGIGIGATRLVQRWTAPWISALYATPVVGLAPLFVIIFGFGLESKVAVVIALAVFPILINAISGARSVGRDYRELAIVFRAHRMEAFRQVLLPGSLPFVLTGLRLAVGRGLIGVVVADLFGASEGLGLSLQRSSQAFDTAGIYAVTALLAFIGIVLSAVIEYFERRAYRRRTS